MDHRRRSGFPALGSHRPSCGRIKIGVNLFNTRAISYVDGDGVAHVMLLGGDVVNAPGNKSDKVIFY